ncbi:hypothetical protein C8Q79DRAFT_317020 [Trametes meyenii]|nr:hypothetical protein C8Q79DRAFT_317020 [Trametes meyenii]
MENDVGTEPAAEMKSNVRAALLKRDAPSSLSWVAIYAPWQMLAVDWHERVQHDAHGRRSWDKNVQALIRLYKFVTNGDADIAPNDTALQICFALAVEGVSVETRYEALGVLLDAVNIDHNSTSSRAHCGSDTLYNVFIAAEQWIDIHKPCDNNPDSRISPKLYTAAFTIVTLYNLHLATGLTPASPLDSIEGRTASILNVLPCFLTRESRRHSTTDRSEGVSAESRREELSQAFSRP